jgi:beta-lactam-binding protein with PASTA domain
MLKLVIILCFAATLAWFFWQGFTGQPYALPGVIQQLKFW